MIMKMNVKRIYLAPMTEQTPVACTSVLCASEGNPQLIQSGNTSGIGTPVHAD